MSEKPKQEGTKPEQKQRKPAPPKGPAGQIVAPPSTDAVIQRVRGLHQVLPYLWISDGNFPGNKTEMQTLEISVYTFIDTSWTLAFLLFFLDFL
jgi:hypothetical protein